MESHGVEIKKFPNMVVESLFTAQVIQELLKSSQDLDRILVCDDEFDEIVEDVMQNINMDEIYDRVEKYGEEAINYIILNTINSNEENIFGFTDLDFSTYKYMLDNNLTTPIYEFNKKLFYILKETQYEGIDLDIKDIHNFVFETIMSTFDNLNFYYHRTRKTIADFNKFAKIFFHYNSHEASAEMLPIRKECLRFINDHSEFLVDF